ncbi:MAG TPA: hypothetical protein VN478_04965 [Clostridia bacterium]|nr:hypothetical protein [Clostridia bacterium]
MGSRLRENDDKRQSRQVSAVLDAWVLYPVIPAHAGIQHCSDLGTTTDAGLNRAGTPEKCSRTGV